MKESDYAKQATKKIETAIPTVASDGSVIRWEISFSYQYESLHPETNALEIRIDEKFDIKKIKE